MSLIFVANLHIFNTLNCNFSCAHCMLGETVNENITEEILETLLKDVMVIGALRFIGGESLMNPEALQTTLDIIKRNKISLYKLRMTTNGSLFTEEVQRILEQYEEYIDYCKTEHANDNFFDENGRSVGLLFSVDKYHQEFFNEVAATNPDMAVRYSDNIKRFLNSKYFYDTRDLVGLYATGMATNLEEAKDEVDNYKNFYYLEKGKKYEGLFVSPSLNILTDGSVSEANGSIEDLKGKYCYGNIMEQDLDQIIKDNFEKANSWDDLNDRQYEEVGRFNMANGFSK